MVSCALTSLDDVERLGSALAANLEHGDIVMLRGPVGAGKTTLVGATGRALGSLEPVRSPTYTIAHTYALADGGTMAHLDLYRQDGQLDAPAWADLEPTFEATYSFVEWPGGGVEDLLAGRRTWTVWLAVATLASRLAGVRAPDTAAALAIADATARAFCPQRA